MIRFGLMDAVPYLSGILQPWFDKLKLTAIKMTQVGWFDRMHTKCMIGGQKADQSKRHVVKLLQDQHGKLDIKGGTFDQTRKLAHTCVTYLSHTVLTNSVSYFTHCF
jgi:hypothetical protein